MIGRGHSIGILDKFFQIDDDMESGRGLHVFRQKLRGLEGMQVNSGFSEAVGIDVIKYYLRHVLGEETLGAGFLTGGMTFCAMLPMRSIPFKVICLLGMNNNSFPRQSRSLGFDLMLKSPRPGDPSRRNDDRYLFLEAILSARERLYISYVGQSIEDNSLIPPSVLVSELLDYIKQGFENLRERYFRTRHNKASPAGIQPRNTSAAIRGCSAIPRRIAEPRAVSLSPECISSCIHRRRAFRTGRRMEDR